VTHGCTLLDQEISQFARWQQACRAVLDATFGGAQTMSQMPRGGQKPQKKQWVIEQYLTAPSISNRWTVSIEPNYVDGFCHFTTDDGVSRAISGNILVTKQ
jgi:hypothetical protein